jgi:hypothetical protein
MIKIIDIDELFATFAKDYIEKNATGLTDEEIEENVDLIFTAFANTPCDELDGLSPKKYYDSFSSEELANALIKHLDSGISPSAYLCESLSNKKGAEEIIATLLDSNTEEKIVYAMNILSDKNCINYLDKYLEFVKNSDSETVIELATEVLRDNAKIVKERVLALYGVVKSDRKVNLVEILSNADKDDRVFEILVNEFNSNLDNIPLCAQYLSRYGDERALPILIEKIESDSIDFADFQELKCAIESLGGEYEAKRDFSRDKAFLAVKNHKHIN